MKKFLSLLILLPLFLFAQDDSLLKIKKVDDIINELKPDKEEPSTKENPADKKETEPVTEKNEVIEKKTPIKKEVPEAEMETSFTGTLAPADVMPEYSIAHTTLWIRARATLGSVALITPYHQWNGKKRYFLRATSNISGQDSNTIYYKGKPLSPSMHFLACSEPVNHPLFGKAFKIIIPNNVIYGYKKNGGKLPIVPGKSELIIRAFEKIYGQGKFKDTIYLLRKSSINRTVSKNSLDLAKKEKVGDFIQYFFSYSSPYPGKKYFVLTQDGSETQLYHTQQRLLPKENLCDECLNILHWNYDRKMSGFHMIFNLTLSAAQARVLSLSILEENETVSYKIDLTQE